MASNDVSVRVHDHGTVVDKQKGRVQCNYCGKVVSGSSRLKCHLAGIRGDVTPCEKAPEPVKEMMKTDLLEKKKGCLSKEVGELEHPDLPWKRGLCQQTNATEQNQHENTSTVESGSSKRVKLESTSVNDRRKLVLFPNRLDIQAAVSETEGSSVCQGKKAIGRFFYEQGIHFNADMMSSFEKMMDSLGCDGILHMIPSSRELEGMVLQNDLEKIQCYVKEIRRSWASTGCSILLDGWTDGKGHELINILVDCPKGAIYLKSVDISAFVGDIHAMDSFLDQLLAEVGVHNIVQIISNSTSECMQTLKMLTEKRGSIFWTLSASRCIEMMLNEIERNHLIKEILKKARMITKFIYNHAFVLKLMKNYTHGHDLIKSSRYKSAASFLTLENILVELENLKKMFSSADWNASIWAATEEGKKVFDLVTDSSFWCEVMKVSKATIPLVSVLNLVNEGDNQHLGYIYETMDQAKETIKEELKNKKSQYMPFWKVIDKIWDGFLHSPLHSAGYFLNPSFFYSEDFLPDLEVVNGLLCCIVRMAENRQVQELITSQLDAYREAKGPFGHGGAVNQRTIMAPVLWWSSYGVRCPELQKLAIQILSQTCNGASRYALNRSLAEKLLTEERGCLLQQRLCDLTFLHYNMRLQKFKTGVNTLADEIDPTDGWIVDKEQELVSPDNELSWMYLI